MIYRSNDKDSCQVKLRIEINQLENLLAGEFWISFEIK